MRSILRDMYHCFLSRRATPTKARNALSALCHSYWKRRDVVGHYPISMTVCPGNVCNLRCALCPTGTKASGRAPGLMSMELFQKLMSECGPYLYDLELYNWGEPFLNKNVFAMAALAKTYNIRVTLSTNLNHFPEGTAEEVVASGIDRLVVSLDGASQESVEKYQTGSSFRDVVEHVRAIRAARRDAVSSSPLLIWRFLVNKHNEDELDLARSAFGDFGFDRLEVGVFRVDMGRELFLSPSGQFELVRDWLPRDEALSMYNYSEMRRKIRPKRCFWLWSKAVVNWDGSVAPCCSVWPREYDFGSVAEQSFFDVWNGEKYRRARAVLRGDGDPTGEGSLICTTCKANGAIIECGGAL